jgi:hypothetical protein
VDGDHGPLRWSLLPYHLWHRLQRHLRLLLRLHNILRDSIESLRLTVRSRPWSCPDSRICGNRARCGGRIRGRRPGQKG